MEEIEMGRFSGRASRASGVSGSTEDLESLLSADRASSSQEGDPPLQDQEQPPQGLERNPPPPVSVNFWLVFWRFLFRDPEPPSQGPEHNPPPPVADFFQVVWRFLTAENTWRWSKTAWRWIKPCICFPFIQLRYGIRFIAKHLINFLMSVPDLCVRFIDWATASRPFRQFLFMLRHAFYIVCYIMFCALIYRKMQHSYEEQMRELERDRGKNFTGFANESLIQPNFTRFANESLIRPFTGNATFTDGLYWCTTTVSTVGYGDIVPKSDDAKVFTCLTVLVGLFVSTMVFQTINEAWSELEDGSAMVIWLQGGEHNTKGRRLTVRRWLAGLYASLCMLFGVLLFKLQEHTHLLDAFYATVVSETTLGYGDISFVTERGKTLASIWLLFATSAMSRVLELQVEARLGRRSKRILGTPLTADELEAYGVHLNDPNREIQFWRAKLRSAKLLDDNDMTVINNQFQLFDAPNHIGAA